MLIFLVVQNVIRLYVTVADSHLVHISDSLEELIGNFGNLHLSTDFDFPQFRMLEVFHDQVGYTFLAGDVEPLVVDDMLMFQHLSVAVRGFEMWN